jgi:hypothetical protein
MRRVPDPVRWADRSTGWPGTSRTTGAGGRAREAGLGLRPAESSDEGDAVRRVVADSAARSGCRRPGRLRRAGPAASLPSAPRPRSQPRGTREAGGGSSWSGRWTDRRRIVRGEVMVGVPELRSPYRGPSGDTGAYARAIHFARPCGVIVDQWDDQVAELANAPDVVGPAGGACARRVPAAASVSATRPGSPRAGHPARR